MYKKKFVFTVYNYFIVSCLELLFKCWVCLLVVGLRPVCLFVGILGLVNKLCLRPGFVGSPITDP